ncbi:MAG: hypothetical protein AAF558_04740 [Verrucomicrobiota bacterium]
MNCQAARSSRFVNYHIIKLSILALVLTVLPPSLFSALNFTQESDFLGLNSRLKYDSEWVVDQQAYGVYMIDYGVQSSAAGNLSDKKWIGRGLRKLQVALSLPGDSNSDGGGYGMDPVTGAFIGTSNSQMSTLMFWDRLLEYETLLTDTRAHGNSLWENWRPHAELSVAWITQQALYEDTHQLGWEFIDLKTRVLLGLGNVYDRSDWITSSLDYYSQAHQERLNLGIPDDIQFFIEKMNHRLLCDAFYFYRSRWVPDESELSLSGAYGHNKRWEEGTESSWYIEKQDVGGELVEAGLLSGNLDWISEGVEIMDWGFDRFNDSLASMDDEIHSTSLFLESAARAMLFLMDWIPPQDGSTSDEYTVYRDWLVQRIPDLFIMTTWLVQQDFNDQVHKRDVNLEPFTHRYFLRAGALLAAAAVIENPQYSTYANDPLLTTYQDDWVDKSVNFYICEGISRQQSDGANPEWVKVSEVDENGQTVVTYRTDIFDASYHMVGLYRAIRCYQLLIEGAAFDPLKSFVDPEHRSTIRGDMQRMLRKAFRRFSTDVTPEGEILLDPLCRTAQETDRDGSPKTINYRDAVRALLFWTKSDRARLTYDDGSSVNIEELAFQILYFRKWLVPFTTDNNMNHGGDDLIYRQYHD